MQTITGTMTLVMISCGGCGITFAVPEAWRQKRERNHSTFYCPNGCPRCYSMESDIERANREAAEERNRAEYFRNLEAHRCEELAAAERSAAALRGVVTRTKNRIGRGVCPCCSRYFKDLHRHMQSQHPTYAEDQP